MSKVSTIGVDLAKSVFQVHGADEAGAVVFRKRLRRSGVVIERIKVALPAAILISLWM